MGLYIFEQSLSACALDGVNLICVLFVLVVLLIWFAALTYLFLLSSIF